MILVLGVLAMPLLRLIPGGTWVRLQQALSLILPVVSVLHMQWIAGLGGPSPVGADPLEVVSYAWSTEMFGYTLTPIRVDRLALVWGWVFHLAALLSAIYALHVKDTLQQVAGLSYAGGAIAAVFAGDLITLFVFWELTAITSVFLIWANRDPGSIKVGLRYLIIQVGSGVLLLAGAIIRFFEEGTLDFGQIATGDPLDAVGVIGIERIGGLLILVAFGIKAAFPLLHNWLQDAYPKATVTGTVFLSAFTTKLAIYALARGYCGESVLIPVGVVMTLFPIFFAVIENDLRRVLAYSLNNQLGYMVVGVGLADFATDPEVARLALNGTAAHAFAHIIYKGLLFMSMGAVLHRVGTIKASELGGLYKSMPLSAAFCIIASLSISGFPLFSGFTTKSMTMTAAFSSHALPGVGMTLVFVGLLIASAGVVDHSGIKIPFFSFFAHDSGKRVKEAPLNMLVAMGAAALICFVLGVYPQPLYDILPTPVVSSAEAAVAGQSLYYQPYDAFHVVSYLQLLLFAALAFVIMMRKGWYPAEIRAENLDTDWIYRRAGPAVVRWLAWVISSARDWVIARALDAVGWVLGHVHALHSPRGGLLGEPWPTGATAKWATALLCMYLLLSYL